MELNQPNPVSVIVPAFNSGPYIGRTLESVLAQTHRNIEVIVVDDGSEDDTADVVRRFAARDKRVRLIQQENQGVAAARNRAIEHSRGEWIAPLDADDLWHPRNLEKKLLRATEVSERVGIIYSGSYLIDTQDRPISDHVTGGPEGNVLMPLLLENFLANGSTPLIRRSCFQEGRYDTGFHKAKAQGCEDWDFYLQVAFRHSFAIVGEPLVYYRRRPGSLSSDDAAMARSYRYMMRRHRSACAKVAAAHLKHSSSNFHFNLAREAHRKNDPVTSNLLLLRAILADPIRMLCCRATYTSGAKFFLSLFGIRPFSTPTGEKNALKNQCSVESR